MTQESQKDIEVFISYSWTTPEHELWVIDLAKRLDENIDIHVTIDKWDLRTGNDMIAFMERMANDKASINKVLIILDEGYTEKSNSRTRGVGIEAQIISPEIYREVNQEKFLPIVRELDEYGKPYMPVFLRGRKYIDFSKDGNYESALEELLRELVDRPLHSRPPKKGPLPNYLFEESIPRHKTTQIANGIDSLLSNRPKQLNFKVQEFLEEFYLALGNFKIEITDTSNMVVGKQIIDRLNEYTPLRNDLLLFFDKIATSGQEFDIDLLINFLNKLPKYTYPSGDSGKYYDAQFDVYTFLIHELFLSLIALFLKNGSYKLVEELLYSSYKIQTNYVSNKSHTYKEFYHYVGSIDDYYKNLIERNLHLPSATLLYERASSLITKAYLIEADLICYHVGESNNIEGNWFPITYIYQSYASLDFFKRINSRRYFEKVKGIYMVSTSQELIERVKKYEQEHPNPVGSSAGFIIPIYRLIDTDKIATER